MSDTGKHKPERHVPTATTGIYYSKNTRGKKTFECRYVTSEGKRVYEVVGTFEAAKARLADMTSKVNRGEVVANSTATLNDVLDGWRGWRKIKQRSERTYENHTKTHITPRFGRMRVRDITRADLRAWLNSMQRKDGRDGPISEGTKAIVLSTLSSILDYCVDAEMIGMNPCRTLGRSKPHAVKLEARILGDGELEALLAACKNFPWLRPIILMTLYGALRLGEVAGLTWGAVDFESGRIVVSQQVGRDGVVGTPKGGRDDDWVPMSPQARKMLAELKLAAVDKSPGAPVFTNTLGGYRHPRDVQRAFGTTRRRAGLSEEPRALRFHDLRHTSISMLANIPGADMVQVQAFARHSNMQTTLGYVHKIEKPEWTDTVGEAFAAFGS